MCREIEQRMTFKQAAQRKSKTECHDIKAFRAKYLGMRVAFLSQ